MDLFLLKKIITAMIMPLNLVFIFLLLSVIFFNSKPAKSIKCLLSALILLFIASMPVTSDSLMAAIEDDYQPFSRSSTPVDYIVTLGGWHTENAALPATMQLNNDSLHRMVETLRVYKIHPEARIITSGHHKTDPVSNGEKMKQALVMLGIPAQKIISENFPKDTEEEALLISPRVQGNNVVLITNASHMPRAINYFNQQGVYPIAAPTGYWVKNIDEDKDWRYYLPSSGKLYQASKAWYESVALMVQWFKTLLS